MGTCLTDRRTTGLLGAAVLAAVAAGCGADDFAAPRTAASSTAASTAATTGTASSSTAATGTTGGATGAPTAPATARGPLVPSGVTDVATGLQTPWGVTFLPDGTALVADRDTGRIVSVPAGGGDASPVGTVPDVVHSGESGLLGLAASPGFATDRTLFAYRTVESGNEVVRMTVGADLRSLSAPTVVLDGIARASNHDGGRIVFGPDGDLWIGTGDAGDRSAAQDRDSLNGKVLRIRPDGSPAPGNPFGTAVYSYGHRNVQGIAFGPDGTAYAAEFGQNTWDELNVLQAGGNYGWPESEGEQGDLGIEPIAQWRTSEASPSGIAYAGGAVWMAGLRGERLWRIPVDGGDRTGGPVAYLDGDHGRLRTAVTAPDGSLWVTTSNTDGRGDPADGDDRILRVELVPGTP